MQSVIISCVLFLLTFWPLQACGSGYGFCRSVTIDHTKVPNTDQTNFTVLFSTTNASFKTVANSGKINNTSTVNGQLVPDDLILSSTTNCATPTTWEVEHYVATTGEIEMWFLVPSLSHLSDTVYTLCYGKVSVASFQGGAIGTAWDSATVAVYHLPDGTTLSPNDSSANLNNAVATGAPTAVAGKIDGGGTFSLGNDLGAVHIAAQDSNNITVSAWIKTSDVGVAESILDRDDHVTNRVYQFRMASGKMQFIPFIGVLNDGIAGTVTINDNVFHHLAATYNGTIARQYIDGVADGTNGTNTGNLNSSAAIGLIIGDAAGAGGQSFVGVIDEGRQANVARTADWIVTEFNNQSAPSSFITLGAETAGTSPSSQVFIF